MNTHGGPDADGVPRYDFSTNANACGPCPEALAAVRAADATRYPDPAGARVKAVLAALHAVTPERVLLLASASEGMQRFSAWAAREPQARVWLPPLHYGDVAQAACAHGLARTGDARAARLLWACEPSSPLGQSDEGLGERCAALRPDQALVLDMAYAPLRLAGSPSLARDGLDRVWRLWSPNKALGLTGVRAAYALAPQGGEAAVQALEALGPSWPLGAHGEALLLAWASAAVQRWLQASRVTLLDWKRQQVARCAGLGWQVLPSDANYFCARLAHEADTARLPALRQAHGIKLRDTASFGLPGHVRLGVLPPQAQAALVAAWPLTRLET